MKAKVKLYIIKRLLFAIPILLGVSIFVFVLASFSPFNVITARYGLEGIDQEQADRLREDLGLNDPIYIQYIDWLKGILQGDFGQSFVSGQEVFPLVLGRLAVSLELAAFGFLWMAIIASVLGILSAIYRGSLIDDLARGYAVMGVSVPDYVIGIYLLLIFGAFLGWFPIGGWVSVTQDPIRGIQHIILPSISAGLLVSAILVRMLRSDILETMNQEHVNAATTLGIPRYKILTQDIIKPAIIPTITTVGMSVAYLIQGVVLIEVVFSIPGSGRLMVTRLYQADVPVITASLLVIALIYIISNLITDVLYFYLDPRIQIEEES